MQGVKGKVSIIQHVIYQLSPSGLTRSVGPHCPLISYADQFFALASEIGYTDTLFPLKIELFGRFVHDC